MADGHTHTNGHTHSHATAAMSEAAASWLDSLSSEQRDKATYEYMDGERVFWYYPPLNRHGLALRDMDDNQRKLAYAIMESGLTERAYKQAAQIIDLETTLGKGREGRRHRQLPARPRTLLLHRVRRPARLRKPLGLARRGTPCFAALQHLGRQGKSPPHRSSSARTRQRCWRDRTRGSASSATAKTSRSNW